MPENTEASPAPPRPGAVAAVERAAGDFRRGVPVAVVDGGGTALIAVAAELVTPPVLAALRAGGVRPAVVLTHQRAETLKIRLYTPDVVAVPLPSDMDAATVRSLADPAEDLAHPLRGPLDARRDGVGPAHIAAAKLAKIAALLPAAVIRPATPDEIESANRADGMLEVRADDVFDYDRASAVTLVQVASARVPVDGAENARLIAFRPSDGGIEHLAIVVGDPRPGEPVLTRLHSECFTGDLLGSLKCDCGQQLRGAIAEIAANGSGVLLYLAQEGRGIGLINKLRAYALQDQGFDTVEANERLGFAADERLFQPAAEMLKKLGFRTVRLMTNNPDKVAALEEFGISVAERVPHKFPSNRHNEFYLRTKAEKSGHLL